MATLLANAPADPAVLFAEEIEDLLMEARNYLDGEPIANEQQADAVSSLINRLRRVSKDADAARVEEKRPHDEAAKAVQTKWKPLLDKADLATSTAKRAIAAWLRIVEDRHRAEAEKARVEAERIAAIAAQAHREAAGNLQASEDAELLLKAADAARKDADKAGKQKAHATGGERAIGLVDVFTPEMVDPTEALKHYKARQPEALKAWLISQAQTDVRAGIRNIPGFTVKHERVAR